MAIELTLRECVYCGKLFDSSRTSPPSKYCGLSCPALLGLAFTGRHWLPSELEFLESMAGAMPYEAVTAYQAIAVESGWSPRTDGAVIAKFKQVRKQCKEN